MPLTFVESSHDGMADSKVSTVNGRSIVTRGITGLPGDYVGFNKFSRADEACDSKFLGLRLSPRGTCAGGIPAPPGEMWHGSTDSRNVALYRRVPNQCIAYLLNVEKAVSQKYNCYHQP